MAPKQAFWQKALIAIALQFRIESKIRNTYTLYVHSIEVEWPGPDFARALTGQIELASPKFHDTAVQLNRFASKGTFVPSF